MSADGHSEPANGGTKTPVVRLKGFGPKTAAAPATEAGEPAAKGVEASAVQASAPHPVPPPTPNFSAVRLKGFGPKTPPEAPPPVTAPASGPPPLADAAQHVEQAPADAPQPAPGTSAANPTSVEPSTPLPPAAEKPASVTGNNPVIGNNPGVRLRGFSSQRPTETDQPDALSSSKAPSSGGYVAQTSPQPSSTGAAAFSRPSSPETISNYRPASEATPSGAAPARYRPDPDVDRMTKRRWWKDRLYTNSGRRAADAQNLNQEQPQI
jgi:hypothetical protein